MKYCMKCGVELADDASFCSNCGSRVEGAAQPATTTTQPEKKKNSDLQMIAKIFMVIGAVSVTLGTCLIGAIWCIPMTMHYFKKTESGEPVSLAFKICTLLFVSQVAGILMLVEDYV